MCRSYGSKDLIRQLGQGVSQVNIFRPEGITLAKWLEHLERERREQSAATRSGEGLPETEEASEPHQ